MNYLRYCFETSGSRGAPSGMFDGKTVIDEFAMCR